MLSETRSRRYERIGLRRGPLVAWQGPAGRTVSRANTLGMGGVFIEAAKPAAIGEGIRVVLKVPGGEVRARGTVRNSHPGKGMGVEFVSMRPEDRARLNRLLRKLLEILRGRSDR